MNALVPAIRPPDLSQLAEGIEGFNEVRRSRAPTDLVWPPTLPIELALKTGTPDQIREEYGYRDVAHSSTSVVGESGGRGHQRQGRGSVREPHRA